MRTKGQERLDAIYSYINTNGFSSVAELSKCFEVSESTIKRDLNALAHENLVRRNHGGVFACNRDSTPPYSIRSKIAINEKFRIAGAAVDFVEDSDVLFIDAGTTNFALYQLIAADNVTVFTTSLSVLVTPNDHIAHVFALEGEAYARSMVLRGGLCVENLERINPDKVFLSSAGLSKNYEVLSKYDSDHLFVRQLLKLPSKKFLLMDSTKIGKISMFRSAPIHSVDVMITDSGIQASDAEAIRARGVELIVV